MRRQSLDSIAARPPLPDLVPDFKRWVSAGVRILAPAYRRFALGIRHYDITGGDELVRVFDEFQNRRCRFALVFRHPNVNDPQCVYYLVSNRIRRLARIAGVSLPEKPHAAFLYGRGVPLWAGAPVGWLLPRIGAMPVMQGWSDSGGLRRIRGAYLDGEFPIALAPEGQVSYHNHRVDRIEPGPARLSLWCYEDLRGAGREEEVYLLPVAPIYRYEGDPWRRIDGIFRAFSKLTGIERGDRVTSRDEALGMVARLAESLLLRIEAHYTAMYGYAPARGASISVGGESGLEDAATAVTGRYRELAEFILDYLESHYATRRPGSLPGDFVPRIFPVRRSGWKRTFRDDIDLGGASRIERVLADRTAAETYLFSRHLEIVDILAYFDLTYAFEGPGANRVVEVALNLYDVASRCMGETVAGRLSLPTHVTMRIGEAIPVSRYVDSKSLDRPPAGKARRKAITDAISADLYTALDALSSEEVP